MRPAIDFLTGLEKQRILIERKKAEIERLEKSAVRMTAFYGERVRGWGACADAEAERICAIADMKKELERQIDGMIDARLKAMRIIDGLDAHEADVIYMRYFEGRKWTDVAKRKNVSEDTAYRLHRRALAKINEYLELTKNAGG